MVLASEAMARRISGTIRTSAIPPDLVQRVAQDPRAGVDAACEQIERLRSRRSLRGRTLVPVARYREMALRLEDRFRGSSLG